MLPTEIKQLIIKTVHTLIFGRPDPNVFNTPEQRLGWARGELVEGLRALKTLNDDFYLIVRAFSRDGFGEDDQKRFVSVLLTLHAKVLTDQE